MTENDMVTLWGNYLKKNLPKESEAYELKFTKGKALGFSELRRHQVEALQAVEKEGLYYRIADQPWGYNPKFRFTLKKPFDCLCLVKIKGYVVVWFYLPRKEKQFVKMEIKNFLKMKGVSKRKSFTEKMALEAGGTLVKI